MLIRVSISIAFVTLIFSACHIATADECDIAAGEINQTFLASPPSGMGIDTFSAIDFIINMSDRLKLPSQLISAFWYHRAANSYDRGEYERALNEINKAIRVYDRHSFSWTLKGCTLYMLGKYSEADSSCDEALELNPDDGRAWHAKGITLYRLGRFKEAVRSCNRALEINASDAKAQEYRILACRSLCGECARVSRQFQPS